ncbi:hypothetical protein F1880_007018 [Penicillium rolfsii]|nr:hypothetical protein F1880_007018 [Penicillium rolfsii]
MAASPYPPSSPLSRGSTDPTSTSPARVLEAIEAKKVHDLDMPADDELVQGSPKEVKLSDPRAGKDAEKAVSLDLTEIVACADASTSTIDCASPVGNALTVPAKFDAESFVVTPPATSPTIGACEGTPVTITEGSLTATPEPTSPVPDAAPPTENSPSRCTTPSDHWCANDYGVFNPDEREKFPFASADGDIFTDPNAFKEYILDCAMMEDDRKFKRHLQDCLRGSARTWYEQELNDDDREDLREGALEHWLDFLCHKFGADFDEVIKVMKDAPWDWSMVRKGNRPEDWLEYQFGCARQVCEDHWEALHLTWEQIDPEMRDDVPEPDIDAKYQGFLRNLEQADKKWHEMLRKKDEREKKGGKGQKRKRGER